MNEALRETLSSITVAAGPDAGVDLAALSDAKPVLIAMLRHTGCPFCQEAMADITEAMPELEERGVSPVLVFQTPEAGFAGDIAKAAGLGNVNVVADPDRALYRAFEVKRGNIWQVFGPQVMVGVVRTVFAGLRPAKKVGGSVMQLPGTVLVHGGKILQRHVHRHQADRANYSDMACSIPLRNAPDAA